MDELLKLEQMQSVLSSLKSHGLVSSLDSADHDSTRFLTNFVLLLVQTCGGLNLGEKCSLVSEFIQKISGAFLEDVASSLRREDRPEIGIHNSGSHCGGGGGDPSSKCLSVTSFQAHHGKIHVLAEKVDEDLAGRSNEEMAMIGLDSMRRANSTLEDFCRSYFMFHGLDIHKPQVMFKYLPVLSFTESYIYQVDTVNEKIVEATTSEARILRNGVQETSHGWVATFMTLFDSGPFRPLAGLLESSGLLTDRIRQEFRYGEEYWMLERKLCRALADKQEISVDDVMRAIQLKSFDYRVLNLLLYQLQGEEVNDLHMEFLSISEFLVEVSDDLFDYEEDVLENNFNVLRMFVRIFGPSNAPARLAKFITEAEDKYENLLDTLDPELSSKYRRRCEEATKEGGKISGHPFGTWNIPPVIANEESYRTSYLEYQ